MTVDKLLPRGMRKRGRKDAEVDEDALLEVQQALAADPAEAAKARLEAKMQRLRNKGDDAEAERFWKSAEGRRVAEMIHEED